MKRNWIWCALPLALLAASVAPEVRAQGQSDLESAEQAYGALDYNAANDLAKRALKNGGLGHAQLVRAIKVLALTHAGLDHAKSARDAFTALLVCDPSFTMDPNLSPRILTPFYEAKGEIRGLSVVPGVHVSVGALRSGDPVTMRVATHDPTHIVKQVVVGYRWSASGAMSTASVSVGDGETFLAPSEAGQSRFDYYAQALDEHRNVLFEDGNPVEVKTAIADAAPAVRNNEAHASGGFLGSTAFWVISGVVVTGAAVAGGAVYFSSRDHGSPTSLAMVPALRCGTSTCN